MGNDCELTICLCNYARTSQTHIIIDELRQQTIPIQIFVWNNNPDEHFESKGADLVINCSRNMHVRHVPALWQMAMTPYVGRMDDDLHFADARVVEDALNVLRQQPQSSKLVGAYGVRIFTDSSYRDGQHISVPKGQGQLGVDGKPFSTPQDLYCDLVKGRFMLANSEAVEGLRANCPHYHVDLYISTVLAGKKRLWHTLAGCFFNHQESSPRLVDFPVDGRGYCDMPKHGEARDWVTDMWKSMTDPDPRVRRKVSDEELTQSELNKTDES